MLSTSLELLGLAALVAGVFVLLGLGAALLAGGVALLFVGVSADGVEPMRVARARVAGLRSRRAAKKSAK